MIVHKKTFYDKRYRQIKRKQIKKSDKIVDKYKHKHAKYNSKLLQ